MDTLPKSLKLYVRRAWHIVEPSRPLVWHWGLDAICEHLEAVTAGQIEKLIINVPPGMLKSTIVAVLWPTWEWTFRAWLKWLFATYSSGLTFRDAGYRKKIMMSPWYQMRWGGRFHLVKEGDELTQNNLVGHMLSTSTGAASTGWRGDRLVLDDPQDPKGAESDVKRASTIEWLQKTWPTRRNAGPRSAEVLIQQRLHERDATGLYLEQGGWVHLKIPLEWKGVTYSTPIGWSDPRHTKAEVISADVYPPQRVIDLKKLLGPYGVAGQLDQEPAPAEGGIIKTAWIRNFPGGVPKMDDIIHITTPRGITYAVKPRDCIRFGVADPATTEAETTKAGKQNDPDFFVLGAFLAFATSADPKNPEPIVALLDVDMGKWGGEEHESKVENFHKLWQFAYFCVETVGFQLSLFQKLKKNGLPVRKLSTQEPGPENDTFIRIDGDKAARAYAACPLMADGRFYTPTYAHWMGEWLKQVTYFPNAVHDDCLDITTYGVAIANNMKYSSVVEEHNRPPEPHVSREDLPPVDQDRASTPWDAVRPASPFDRR